MSVNEYVTKFTQLSRYAPHEVDTSEKKQECFLNGLNNGLAYALEARDFENFQGMVNKALVLEKRSGPIDRRPFIGPQTHERGPRDFFQKNNSLLIKILVTFAHRTLIFSNINPQSKSFIDFTARSLVFEFYLQISP
jgi:hypothetical protein